MGYDMDLAELVRQMPRGSMLVMGHRLDWTTRRYDDTTGTWWVVGYDQTPEGALAQMVLQPWPPRQKLKTPQQHESEMLQRRVEALEKHVAELAAWLTDTKAGIEQVNLPALRERIERLERQQAEDGKVLTQLCNLHP